jgi:AGZA family xanthine/uracil permease-like MFS transporter
MQDLLERFFKLKENETTVSRELVAGATTFVTMCYIIFVQPIILAAALRGQGDADAFMAGVFAATCIGSASATFLMAFLANYPIALAPAMGHNVFFAFTVCGTAAAGGFGFGWNAALGAVFISGCIFLVLSFFGFREKLVNAIPRSMKNAIAVGIGLLIALVGLEYAGLVIPCPGTHIGLNPLMSRGVALALTGLGLVSILIALKVRGAILISILVSAALGVVVGVTKLPEQVGSLPRMSYTLLALDIPGVFTAGTGAAAVVIVIFVFFFLDLFDTVGTLVGVGERAGFIKEDGTMPKARQALFSDAAGTVIGATLGTSTITSYIESAAGVASGGRTGLANVATGILFVFALFFYPVVQMVSASYQVAQGIFIYPIIAPALIIVGSMMAKSVLKIDWDDPTEYIPAFMTIIIMPVTFNIAMGIGFGFITYSLLKLVTGRLRDASPLIYVFAVLFLVFFAAKYVFVAG